MAKPKKRKKGVIRRLLFRGLVLAVLAAVGYGGYLAWIVTSEFDGRSWDRPAVVYAAPLEIYGGRKISRDELALELTRLGYREARGSIATGEFRRDGGALEVSTRAFALPDATLPERVLKITFTDQAISAITDLAGALVPIMQLDPLVIGSIFPVHGEDRIIVAPDEIPPLLTAALIAVEDRRFESHLGIDLRAIARAALVNLSAREIRQGASTLTQQLVRSYYLTNDRTWQRKLREAFMSVALELRHDKDALLHAYVNEIYLGQDGGRAIHGFGLASRFYFGKPLSELELHEIALLIAQVRGPSFYDPRRHPERALERRNLVLDQMLALDVISSEMHTRTRDLELDVVGAASRRSAYYVAFLDLVRRQLRRDYAEADLNETGLRVYTTLDPTTQAAAESSLVSGLDALQPDRPMLEGAVIITNPHNAEVRALVGSRQTGFDGFNRALDAKRPVGSLIKPVIYLAALESGQHSLATIIDDEAIDVPLDNGTTWSPSNFNGEAHGPVTAIRALAESFNMATVRLGLEVGLEPIGDLLARLGLDKTPALYPSLLLGALELSPLEVTQIYNSLANGGFRLPLRAVRAVVASDGSTVQRYPLKIEQAADPAAVFGLNQALVQVMARGTGRAAQATVGDGLVTAGKTGTSDGFRDSWFAGFTNDQLVVTWVGNDENLPTGLTGSTGASRIWAAITSQLETVSYSTPAPTGYEWAWIDYGTGLETEASCPNAVQLATSGLDRPPKAVACGSDKVRIGSRLRRWFRNALN